MATENFKTKRSILWEHVVKPPFPEKPKIRQWKVNKDGDLVRIKTKEGKRKHYVIAKSRLTEPDWVSHMLSKFTDFDEYGEFVCAYLKACEMAGIKNIQIRLWGDFNEIYDFSNE